MEVSIHVSSSEEIDEKYKAETTKVCEYLAQNGCDLNWGSGSFSLMGVAYDAFVKYNRKICGYTSFKYVDEIPNLKDAESHRVYSNTFALKENLFEASDFILILPGGTGTISEFFSFLEEIRSNDNYKPLILYNESHHFDSVLALIDDLVERKFNSNSIYESFIVANNLDEFKEIYEEIKNSLNK